MAHIHFLASEFWMTLIECRKAWDKHISVMNTGRNDSMSQFLGCLNREKALLLDIGCAENHVLNNVFMFEKKKNFVHCLNFSLLFSQGY